MSKQLNERALRYRQRMKRLRCYMGTVGLGGPVFWIATCGLALAVADPIFLFIPGLPGVLRGQFALAGLGLLLLACLLTLGNAVQELQAINVMIWDILKDKDADDESPAWLHPDSRARLRKLLGLDPDG